jgi:3-methylcrotonyl-CoA carboxylase alpha subunit
MSAQAKIEVSHTFSPPGGDHSWYFNFGLLLTTRRLQVEHPITEQIAFLRRPISDPVNKLSSVLNPITEQMTAIDLVEWQLRIAAGEELPTTNQDDIVCMGHAFEARIYAENPARNFLPATGKVWHHQPPATPNIGMDALTGIRVDTGIESGQEVGVYYDPMICKLIVHDQDRPRALNKLVAALKNYQIAGVPTNIEFLINCAEHPTFQKAGAVNTGFLDDHLDQVQLQEHLEPSPLATAVGAFCSLLHLEGRIGIQNLQQERLKQSPWSSLSGSWRMLGGRARRVLKLSDSPAGTELECLSNRDGSFHIRVGGGSEEEELGEWFHVDGSLDSNCNLTVVVNQSQRLVLTSALDESNGKLKVRMWPQRKTSTSDDEYLWEVDIENPMIPSSQPLARATEGAIKAPMPGKISRINFEVGDVVQEGDVLLVMEAMKMEHPIRAPRQGVLTELHYKVADVVNDGVVLATVESEESAEEEAV